MIVSKKSVGIGVATGLLSALAGLWAAWQLTYYVSAHASTIDEVHGTWAHTARLHSGKATVYSEDSIPLSHIRITAPDGSPVPLTASHGTWVFAGSLTQVPSIAVFDAPTDGVYTYQASSPDGTGTGLVVYQTVVTFHRSIPGVLAGLVIAGTGATVAAVRVRRASPQRAAGRRGAAAGGLVSGDQG
ncbi:MAG: hypothetical protein HOW97_01015 [Catenulispora sp.]|nr:hypothetical protein [Catenulispora sp.]